MGSFCSCAAEQQALMVKFQKIMKNIDNKSIGATIVLTLTFISYFY